jgi:hypothetical protein
MAVRLAKTIINVSTVTHALRIARSGNSTIPWTDTIDIVIMSQVNQSHALHRLPTDVPRWQRVFEQESL